VENGDPSSIVLVSSSSVRCTSCNRVEREASCWVAALVSLHRRPADISFCKISHTNAWVWVWWEYKAGKAVARVSGRSHLSCQNSTDLPLFAVQVVICRSVSKCLAIVLVR
jgi:hypothetical protein